MSRRNNKIATQAKTADLVSPLSEAAGSSSSLAPVHATRGASAALLAKEIIPNPQRLRPAAQGWDSAPFHRWRRNQFRQPAAVYFCLRMIYLRVINSNRTRNDVAESPRSNDITRGNVA